jgi:hypothetical protein
MNAFADSTLPLLPAPGSWAGANLLVAFIFAHFVGDFVFQSAAMAVGKTPGGDSHVAWGWWLTAHASCHGLLILLLSGSWILGLAEALSHTCIDWLKIQGKLSFAADQILHLICKGLWFGLLVLR